MCFLYDTKYINEINLGMMKICWSTFKHLKMHQALDYARQSCEFSSQCVYIFGIELYYSILDTLEIDTDSRHRSLEFMAHVSEKLCTNDLLMIQTESQIVERIYERAKFISSLIVESFPS